MKNKIDNDLLFAIFRDKNYLKLSNRLRDKVDSAFYFKMSHKDITSEFADSFFSNLNLEKNKLNDADKIDLLLKG